jgi:hypothetical protein
VVLPLMVTETTRNPMTMLPESSLRLSPSLRCYRDPTGSPRRSFH